MNRMDEYKALLSKLEQTPPALEYTIPRARARRRRRQWLWRPMTTPFLPSLLSRATRPLTWTVLPS